MTSFSLDIRTLSVVLMLVSIVLSITLLLVWRTRKTYPGFGLWAAGNSAYAVGFLLIALRGHIPDLLSVILANALLLSATALFLDGICRFRGFPSCRNLSVSLVAIPVLIVTYYTLVDNNMMVRIVIFSIFSTALFGLAAWRLIRSAPPDMRFPFWFTGSTFAIYGLVMFSRIFLTAFSDHFDNLFTPNIIQTLTFLVPVLLGILWTFGFVMLNSERLERDLKDAHAGLERQATTDYLTGIANLRRFSEAGKQEIQRARRYGRPLAVLMLDLDHFKQVNDTYGHAVGDGVLVSIAATFRSVLRDIDVYGRLGGEEFAILLPETDMVGGRMTAERLRLAIAETWVSENDVTLHVTVSIGVAVLSANDAGLDAVLKRADDAMYEAKRAGRNRVMTAPMPEETVSALST
jgi:diguanylate cyclase (GGDEF)-like protein